MSQLRLWSWRAGEDGHQIKLGVPARRSLDSADDTVASQDATRSNVLQVREVPAIYLGEIGWWWAHPRIVYLGCAKRAEIVSVERPPTCVLQEGSLSHCIRVVGVHPEDPPEESTEPRRPDHHREWPHRKSLAVEARVDPELVEVIRWHLGHVRQRRELGDGVRREAAQPCSFEHREQVPLRREGTHSLTRVFACQADTNACRGRDMAAVRADVADPGRGTVALHVEPGCLGLTGEHPGQLRGCEQVKHDVGSCTRSLHQRCHPQRGCEHPVPVLDHPSHRLQRDDAALDHPAWVHHGADATEPPRLTLMLHHTGRAGRASQLERGLQC
eukprot:m.102737 g.102737  ORF g.102737 m.102737 type:complete len:329 (+) comp20834_c0_seq2:97-1083(+)